MRAEHQVLDSFDNALDALLTRSAQKGEIIWTGRAVEQLKSARPNSTMSEAEMAEALLRAAAARGVPVAVRDVN